MIPEHSFREIMDLVMSDNDKDKTTGASAVSDVASPVDITQANAFAEAMARRAATEPVAEVQLEFFIALLDLIEYHDIDPATLQPVFEVARAELTEENAGYVDSFIEYRDLPR